MTTTRVITICSDGDDLARRAAGLFREEAAKAIAARGQFVAALAGGSTPKKTYEVLAQAENANAISWDKVYCFFGDERLVAPDNADSNLGMARETLLSRVSLPESHVFAMKTDAPNAAEAAAEYEQQIAAFFSADLSGAPPAFDLILLGLGDDGHTASLFPGKPAVDVRDHWVVGTPPGTLPPPVDRITFTFPLINAAHHVVFLVSGAKKADIARGVMESDPAKNNYPAANVMPTQGVLTWLIDRDAAAKMDK